MKANEIKEKEMRNKNEVVKVFTLKASHITGLIISSYLTTILLSIDISEQTISYIIAMIGFSYPLFAMLNGIMSDFYGRARVFRLGKIISCILLVLAIFFAGEKASAVIFVTIICIENGIEPLISAIATDISDDRNRNKVFSMLHLGGSCGMAVISLVSAYLLDFSLQMYLIILLGINITSIYIMKSLPLQGTILKQDMKRKREKNIEKDTTINYSLKKSILGNRILWTFSLALVCFSFLSSQLNYSFVLKLKNDFGNEVVNKLGWLLFVYNFVMSVSNQIICRLTSRNSCKKNIIIAGFIYILSMLIIANSSQIIPLAIAITAWAIAQMIIYINNSVFIAENCQKSNVGIITAFFPIISSSGVVYGPILSGILIPITGIQRLWWVMAGIGAIGTGLMYLLYKRAK